MERERERVDECLLGGLHVVVSVVLSREEMGEDGRTGRGAGRSAEASWWNWREAR